MFSKTLLPATRFLLMLSLVTGVIYPLTVTVIGKLLFPAQAEGSMVKTPRGVVVGSKLIGQKWTSNKYFHGRPSVVDNKPLPSGASNLGPTSQALKDAARDRETEFRRMNGLREDQQVPQEMLFASGSGLDPHISPSSALLQCKRIALARGIGQIGKAKLYDLVNDLTQARSLGFLGEPTVNVLALNLELDRRFPSHEP